jgi:hypothetical protein
MLTAPNNIIVDQANDDRESELTKLQWESVLKGTE